jgi:hypothetical protein
LATAAIVSIDKCVAGIVEIDLQTLGVWEKMLFKGRRRKP